MAIAAIGLAAALAVLAGVVALVRPDDAAETTGTTESAQRASSQCDTVLRVVTARSFAPVLTSLARSLETGDDCVALEVETVEGRAAPAQVAELEADVWIPDDAAWAETAGSLELAEEEVAGSGTVVATSPIYMVTDEATAEKVTDAGGSWLGLAELVTSNSGVKLVVRDPNGSGDGLIGIGSVGEAVWQAENMDASAEALATALPTTRTVEDQALPEDDGDVGLVSEYALVRLLENPNREAAAGVRNAVILTGSDYTAQLRYTWFPTAAAADNPDLAAAMERVLSTLTGADGAEAIGAAGLRIPDGGPPPNATDALPEISAAPFEVMGGHAVDHVFATWYQQDRQSDLLLVIDVSGSMREIAPGSNSRLIDIVADSTLALGELLPDNSELAIWEFGSLLDPPRDYRTVLSRAPLNAAQRERLATVAGSLDASDTGTGLYDSTLAAYLTARDGYREGVSNHVVVFTDGQNRDDVETIEIGELTAQLVAAQDPERPVELTMLLFGPEPDVDLLEGALEPVEANVETLATADEVRAKFIHLAAGGVHH